MKSIFCSAKKMGHFLTICEKFVKSIKGHFSEIESKFRQINVFDACYKNSVISTSNSTTARKCKTFIARSTQIFREIKFGKLRGSKAALLVIFGGAEF